MKTPQPREVTQLLQAWSDGDRAALDQLIPLVQTELHRLAQCYLRQERSGHTLQTTALVNEAYLQLIEWGGVRWQDRAHFFGVAAQLMRHILVDYARRRQCRKRGGEALRVSLGEAALIAQERDVEVLALDEALAQLAVIDPRKGQIVELRYFGGLSVEEAAEVLKVSPRTVMREWSMAQAWLYRELSRGRVG